jgi:hypothetical protein
MAEKGFRIAKPIAWRTRRDQKLKVRPVRTLCERKRVPLSPPRFSRALSAEA